MADYTNNLRLTELATGEGSGTWGTTTNLNLKAIAEGLGYNTAAIAGDTTFTIPDGRTATATDNDKARSMYFALTSSGSLSGTKVITFAPNTISRVMLIENATTGTAITQIKQGSGGTVNIPNGKTKLVYMDGAGTGAKVIDISATLDLTGVDINGASSITGTSLDINGNADISGDLTLSAGADGALRFSAASSIKMLDNSATSLVIEEADNAYITFDTTNSSEKIAFAKLAEFASFKGTSATTVTDIKDEDDMSSNSATALATQQSIKAYVDSQIVLFDTLSEVLAAGNTTGGNNIVFGDSSGASDDRLVFGAGTDLEIYHNGSHSYILEGNSGTGTGSLKIGADELDIVNSANSETKAKFTTNGAVDLYFDNSVKLSTSSNGIQVNTDLLLLETDSNSGSGAGPTLTLQRKTSGAHPQTNDNLGEIVFKGEDGGGVDTTYVKLLTQIADATAGSEDAKFIIQGVKGGVETKNLALFRAGLISLGQRNAADGTARNENQPVEINGPHYSRVGGLSGNRFVHSEQGLNLEGAYTNPPKNGRTIDTISNTSSGTACVVTTDDNHGFTDNMFLYVDNTGNALLDGKSFFIMTVDGQPKQLTLNNAYDGGNPQHSGATSSSGVIGGLGFGLRIHNTQSNSTYEQDCAIELGGNDNVFIDLKKPNDNDYDLRLAHLSNDTSYLTSKTGGLVLKTETTANVLIQHNSNTILSAQATGIVVTGTVTTAGINTSDHVVIDNNKRIKLKDTSGNTATEIYTDGSNNTFIAEGDSSGSLTIKGESFYIKNADNQALVTSGGGSVQLAHCPDASTSNPKLETTPSGVNVTGTVTADALTMGDNEKITLGAGGDLEIFSDGATSFIQQPSGATGSDNLVIKGQNILIKNDANQEIIGTFSDVARLSNQGNIKLVTQTTGVQITGDLKLEDGSGNVTTITEGASGNITLTLPSSAGTLALTSDIAGTTVTNATNAAHVLVTDNESTSENNLIAFVEDAASSTGNHGLEMDGNFTYNPSSGTVTATAFAGALTGDVTGNVSGSSGSCTGNAATATSATSATTATTATNATKITTTTSASGDQFSLFVDSDASNNQFVRVHGEVKYNTSDAKFTVDGTVVSDAITSSPSLANGTSLITGNISSADFKSYAGQRIVYYGSGAGEFDLFDAAAADIGKTFVIVNASDDTITLDVDGGGTAQYVGVLTGSSNDGQNTNITIVTGGVAELVCVRGTANGGSAAAPNFIIFGSGI